MWFSLDPRGGEVSQYPRGVIERLEAAHLAGGSHEVRLTGLGGLFECIVIDLGAGTQHNPLTGGKRDVRRLVVRDDATEARVNVYRDRGWRIAENPVVEVTEERVLRLRAADDEAGGGDADEVEGREQRLAAAAACKRDGLVGLWEWCRVPAAEPEGVPRDMWGVYSEEQDRAIEEAFCVGSPGVCVTIGIRNYEVTFCGTSGGRQEDRGMRKRRLVRRRLVQPAQREAELCAAVRETNADPELADSECAICCASFAETAAIPVVRLPGCGHCFHGACVQHLADMRGTCPFCRAEVDWVTALAPCARTGVCESIAVPTSPAAAALPVAGGGLVTPPSRGISMVVSL